LFVRTNGGSRATIAGLEFIETSLLILEDVDAATMAKMVRNSLPVAVRLAKSHRSIPEFLSTGNATEMRLNLFVANMISVGPVGTME
jgi:DNA-binding transcriptional LysR family regulator